MDLRVSRGVVRRDRLHGFHPLHYVVLPARFTTEKPPEEQNRRTTQLSLSASLDSPHNPLLPASLTSSSFWVNHMSAGFCLHHWTFQKLVVIIHLHHRGVQHRGGGSEDDGSCVDERGEEGVIEAQARGSEQSCHWVFVGHSNLALWSKPWLKKKTRAKKTWVCQDYEIIYYDKATR